MDIKDQHRPPSPPLATRARASTGQRASLASTSPARHAPRSLYVDACQDVHTGGQDVHTEGGIEATENLKTELHRGKFTSIYCFNVFLYCIHEKYHNVLIVHSF